jgi:glycosyltransferase involved in cell wall biosynthesis
MLADELLPALASKGIRATLLIAGARPVRSIQHLQHREGITVRGWMEDIREAYADGRIFVAPMFSGLGLQNKILEAMAMSLPCVTTTMVNNAIGAIHGESIFIADTAGAMADHVARLLRDTQLAAQIAVNARRFVIQNYNWDTQVDKLDSFLQTKSIYQSV